METIEGLTRVRIFVPTKGYKPLINNKLGFESFYGQKHVSRMVIRCMDQFTMYLYQMIKGHIFF